MAHYFVRAASVDDIRETLVWARDRDLPLLVLGGGSNVLIADEGFAGLVVHIELQGITIESDDGHAIVKVAAGEPWDPFVAMAVERGWAGIECLSGIPGLIGATPIQNVGAYGQDVSETIIRLEALDRATGLVTCFTNRDCQFDYRSSLFRTHEKDRYVILSVTFRLKRGGKAAVRYPELRQHLESRGESVKDLARVRSAVIAIRRRKGMVIDPNDPDTRSDGSFFMNPIISREQYERFARKAREVVGVQTVIPSFPNADGSVKLSAAWLIERAGFQKGFVYGNVGISSKHTLAVINRGGGTAREVLELARTIQNRVRDVFAVELHPEPVFVGA